MSVTIYTSSTSTTAPEVNMANGNAIRVLDLVGITGDDAYCGSMSGEDLLGRVLVALALTPEDEGTDTYEAGPDEGHFQGGTHIFCGRRPGYLQDRLEQLHDIATFAAAEGATVRWS